MLLSINDRRKTVGGNKRILTPIERERKMSAMGDTLRQQLKDVEREEIKSQAFDSQS